MRTVNAVQNVRWAHADQTQIDMDVDFNELDEVYVPFTADPNDVEPHGRDLYNAAIRGDYGPIAPYTPPPNITGDDALELLRAERNDRLVETDYIEMPTYWAGLTSQQQADWTTYRNALRDLTDTYPNPSWVYDAQGDGSWSNVTWPVKPS